MAIRQLINKSGVIGNNSARDVGAANPTDAEIIARRAEVEAFRGKVIRATEVSPTVGGQYQGREFNKITQDIKGMIAAGNALFRHPLCRELSRQPRLLLNQALRTASAESLYKELSKCDVVERADELWATMDKLPEEQRKTVYDNAAFEMLDNLKKFGLVA